MGSSHEGMRRGYERERAAAEGGRRPDRPAAYDARSASTRGWERGERDERRWSERREPSSGYAREDSERHDDRERRERPYERERAGGWRAEEDWRDGERSRRAQRGSAGGSGEWSERERSSYDERRRNEREAWAESDEEGERGSRGDADSGTHYRGTYRRRVSPYSYRGSEGVLVSESLVLTGPHAGRGPKGYTRSDDLIVEDVSRSLQEDGRVDASEIEVSCEQGVVTLKGKVEDRKQKRAAEDCAEDVYGVDDVMNELRVERGFFQRLLGSSDDRDPAEDRTKGNV